MRSMLSEISDQCTSTTAANFFKARVCTALASHHVPAQLTALHEFVPARQG